MSSPATTIRTCLDFRRANGGTVKRLLTVVGFDLWREMNGERVTGIRPDRPARKVIARGGSLAGHVTSARELYGWLARNAERLVEELEYANVKPARLGVHVHYQDGVGGGTEVRLAYPSALFGDVMEAAKRGLRTVWRPGHTATHMHLMASDLRPAGCWQPSLFDAPDDRQAAVAKVKREVNATLGRFTLRSGATLYVNPAYSDPANSLDICDIRGKFCF